MSLLEDFPLKKRNSLLFVNHRKSLSNRLEMKYLMIREGIINRSYLALFPHLILSSLVGLYPLLGDLAERLGDGLPVAVEVVLGALGVQVDGLHGACIENGNIISFLPIV